MRGKRLPIGLRADIATFTVALFVAITCAAQQETVLHSFGNGTDASLPLAGLIFDGAGNLYGAASGGGVNGLGAVFELSPQQGGGYTETVLHSFGSGTDGQIPYAPSLVFDAAGNLYGTTNYGGVYNDGTAFELTPNGHGVWTETVLYSFGNGTVDGQYPFTGLIFDAAGNLYGTTYAGGIYGYGTAFELLPAGGGTWTETVLYNFGNGTGVGRLPRAGLIFDAAGNLYGVCKFGGLYGSGTAFELSPNGQGGWTDTTLHTFNNNGSDGYQPLGNLILDAAGNLYGTTYTGGIYCSGSGGCGTVFELSPQEGGGYTETVLHSFGNGTDGQFPSDTLILDAAGDLYGTTSAGGVNNFGTVFKMLPQEGGGYSETVLHSFVVGGDGTDPWSNLIFDNAGNLYGTTRTGGGYCTGTGGCGTVFELQTGAPLYTLTVLPIGNGTVTSADGFINCPGTCSHSYAPETQVTLDATPGPGWVFGGWNGGCLGTGSCMLTVTQTSTVDAIFSQALQLVAVTPCRVVDTRGANGLFGGPPIQGGTSRSFPIPQQPLCDIPASAAAYSLNVTVVPGGPLGYLTIWPTGENQPVVSTLNSPDGRVKANAAIVPAGLPSGAVSVYASNTTNVILDIDGYFTVPGSETYQFYSLTPCRIVDTRSGDGGMLQPGVERDYTIPPNCAVPTNATAYSFNVTVLPAAGGLDYLTVWPKGELQPVVSTLNDNTGTVVANAAIVPAGSENATAFYAHSNATNLLVDVDGYFAAPGTGGLSLYPVAPCRVLDTRQNNGQPFSGKLTVNVLASACAPPSTAAAFIFNATVVPPGSMPFLTLWPDGLTQPNVSTLNAYDGFITSNMAIVPTHNGSIDAYADALTQLILDISGYFAP